MANSPFCRHCPLNIDNAEHTFFHCSKWKEEREKIKTKIGSFSKDEIITKMLQGETYWNSVQEYVESILRQKMIDERNNSDKAT